MNTLIYYLNWICRDGYIYSIIKNISNIYDELYNLSFIDKDTGENVIRMEDYDMLVEKYSETEVYLAGVMHRYLPKNKN